MVQVDVEMRDQIYLCFAERESLTDWRGEEEKRKKGVKNDFIDLNNWKDEVVINWDSDDWQVWVEDKEFSLGCVEFKSLKVFSNSVMNFASVVEFPFKLSLFILSPW